MNLDLIFEITDADIELQACNYPSRFFATREDVDRAISAIRESFPGWAEQPWSVRETNLDAAAADPAGWW
jgi:acyl-CoA reductase-like NAD-dependent aldehyde dehydrogenase